MNYQEMKQKVHEIALKYIQAMGGVANIVEVEACSTRLRVILKDNEGFDKEGIMTLGAKGILDRQNNEKHIVIGVEAEQIVEEIEGIID